MENQKNNVARPYCPHCNERQPLNVKPHCASCGKPLPAPQKRGRYTKSERAAELNRLAVGHAHFI